MPTYEILATAFTTLIVEADDVEAALKVAADQFEPRGMELEEMKVDHELLTKQEIKSAIRASEWHSSDQQKVPYVQ